MSKYVKATCDSCGTEFERFHCHPYIVKCKECRKGASKSKAVARKGKVAIGNIVVRPHHVKKVLYQMDIGYQGGMLPSDGLDVVTYKQKNGEWYIRIQDRKYFSRAEFEAEFLALLSDSRT